jgi:hypothetical protein
MDRFEFAIDSDGKTDRQAALNAMTAFTIEIANHYRVCPLCLTYTFAQVVQDAEASGSIAHTTQDHDEGETLQ